MNLFRNYLEDINNSLNKPQKGLTPIMEATKKTAGKHAPAGLNVGEDTDGEFSAEDVVYWKGRAEKYFTDYVADKVEAAPTNLDFPVDTHPGDTSSEGAPF